MKTNVMYRMALANDVLFLNELAGDANYPTGIELGPDGFGVVAVAEESSGFKNIGASWAMVNPQGVTAYVHVLDTYDSGEIRNQLREKLAEKAKDRNIESLDFQ
ncbi:MAG: hypothetical protein QM632_01040 [Micrococcaceae bacterium]